MDNCSRHKKEIAGISDMKQLAEMIGDLHYEALSYLLLHIANKLYEDSVKDFRNGKTDLSGKLNSASDNVRRAYDSMNQAWQISKPFMETQHTKQ